MTLRTRCALLVAAVTIAMAYLYGRIDIRSQEYATWELHDYRAMAAAAPGFTEGVRRPFVYRVLGPYVAGLLPSDDGFALLAPLAGLALALVFFFYLERTAVGPAAAALATLLFVLNKYLFGFALWDYYQLNDLLAEIEIVLLVWAVTARRWGAYAALLLLGALTKETPFIAAAAGLAFVADRGELRQAGGRWLLATLPAVAVFVILRTSLHGTGGAGLTEALAAYGGKIRSPETWFRILINAFIPLSLLPVVYAETTRAYCAARRHEAVFFLLVVASTFFGYNNERLMAPAAVVFYTLIAVISERHLLGVRPLAALVILSALVSALHHTYARYPLPRDVTVALSLAACGLVTVAAGWHRIAERRMRRGRT